MSAPDSGTLSTSLKGKSSGNGIRCHRVSQNFFKCKFSEIWIYVDYSLLSVKSQCILFLDMLANGSIKLSV